MSQPEEPLLPIDAPRSPSRRIWILAGAALLAAGGAVTVALLRPAAPPPEAPAAQASHGPGAGVGARPGAGAAARPADSEERAAGELYQSAEAFERAHPEDPERVSARYLEVFHHHPTTPSGRRAEEKAREIRRTIEASLDREFQGVEKEAASQAAAGRYLDAIATVQKYLGGQPKEVLRRRADRQIATFQNASRDLFNRAAAQAGELARNADYPRAIATLERVREGAILEVSERCRAAIAQLREAQTAYLDFQRDKALEDSRSTFRAGAGARVLALVRARRYEEGLAAFDAAGSDPSAAALKEELARERWALAQAAGFWESFLKTVRARATQELTITPANPKAPRITGRLSKIGPDRLAIDTGESTVELTFDQIHLDQVVAWSIGKSLPADDSATYSKAALFFFLDGHDDLAGRYLATAKEMGADIAEAERVFREGLLRASAAPK